MPDRTTQESIEFTMGDKRVVQVIALAALYQQEFPKIRAYILSNNGSTDDAKDVFQETMMVLMEKAKNPDFILTSSLSTFLFAISKNIWLSRLKEKGKILVCDLAEDISEVQDDKSELIDRKISLWLSQITARCQHIIQSLFFLSEPMVNVARRMGWKNRHTADNQKYKCIQQLKKVSNP